IFLYSLFVVPGQPQPPNCRARAKPPPVQFTAFQCFVAPGKFPPCINAGNCPLSEQREIHLPHRTPALRLICSNPNLNQISHATGSWSGKIAPWQNKPCGAQGLRQSPVT